jgi:creatinine amidohydrolase
VVRAAEMNWMQVEEYLRHDDRAVLPIGSTEQHAYLSLATDLLLAERVAVESAEPLRVVVFPVLAYGLTPHFRSYPGTISLRLETLVDVLRDALDSLAGSGFRRILIVNGHGGNTPAKAACETWAAARPGIRIRFHNWWNAPRTWEKVKSIDPAASHASWMESFPWTRVAGVAPPPEAKPMVDWSRLSTLDPEAVRQGLGDGSFGGAYQRSDHDMRALWQVAVEETRTLLEGSWD